MPIGMFYKMGTVTKQQQALQYSDTSYVAGNAFRNVKALYHAVLSAPLSSGMCYYPGFTGEKTWSTRRLHNLSKSTNLVSGGQILNTALSEYKAWGLCCTALAL